MLGSPPTSLLANLDVYDFDTIALDTDLFVTQRRQIAYDIINGRMTKTQEAEARRQYDLSDIDLDRFRREIEMGPPAPGNFSRGKDLSILQAERNAMRNSPSLSSASSRATPPPGYNPPMPSPPQPGPSNARSPRPGGGGGGGSPGGEGGGSPGGGGGGSPGGGGGGGPGRRLSQDGLRRQLGLLNSDALM